MDAPPTRDILQATFPSVDPPPRTSAEIVPDVADPVLILIVSEPILVCVSRCRPNTARTQPSWGQVGATRGGGRITSLGFLLSSVGNSGHRTLKCIGLFASCGTGRCGVAVGAQWQFRRGHAAKKGELLLRGRIRALCRRFQAAKVAWDCRDGGGVSARRGRGRKGAQCTFALQPGDANVPPCLAARGLCLRRCGSRAHRSFGAMSHPCSTHVPPTCGLCVGFVRCFLLELLWGHLCSSGLGSGIGLLRLPYLV